MDGWITKKLEDVVDLKRGFDLPTHARRPGPYPVLSSGVTAGWHDEGPIKGPGLVIGRATNLGQPTWSNGDFWPLNTTLYAADFHGNEPRWVFHLFESMDLTGFDSGSVQPMLNRNYIAQLPISVPPIKEQRAIAEVLGALDDKIAANTKLAETSAELARALYENALSEGASDVSLADVAALLTRGVAPKYSEDDDSIVVLNQKCIRGQRVTLEPARKTVPTKVREDKLLQPNDVLVNSTGQGTLGRVARWTSELQATADSHISIVRFDRQRVDPACAGFAVLRMQQVITDMGEGSTGQTELSRAELGKLRISLPPEHRQAELGERLGDMNRMEAELLGENLYLAATRDALLPQLMSGKLRVKDIENTMGEMV